MSMIWWATSGTSTTGRPEAASTDRLQGIDALDREFIYDALYRLRSATGRECDLPPDFPWDDAPRSTDLTKTRSYTEQYLYDLAGNIEQLKHLANGGGFTRDFSLVPGNNRLRQAERRRSPVFDYQYDANGNMTAETTSRHFEWDYADRMRVYRTQTGWQRTLRPCPLSLRCGRAAGEEAGAQAGRAGGGHRLHRRYL